MIPLYSAPITTPYGQKSIEVYCCDICNFDEKIDILTTSAFMNCYSPTPRTVFEALSNIGISVQRLSRHPFIDLRNPCHVWLSDAINNFDNHIKRISCIEMIGVNESPESNYNLEHALVNSMRAYFDMLDIAAVYDVKMETVALPLLGSGRQNISAHLTIVPLVNECVSFLKRNSEVKRICFIEKNEQKACMISDYIQNSYNLLKQDTIPRVQESSANKAYAFISYASEDKNIADNLCSKLERNGIQVWYAPRDVIGPYADAIMKGIDKCSHFIVILSRNSMASQHVLNEIDVAFQKLPNNIKFKPLRIDDSLFTPSFKYYLSRQHWMDAIDPPLEDRLNEFVNRILEDV